MKTGQSSAPAEQRSTPLRPELGGGFSRTAVIWFAVIGTTSFLLAILLAVFGQDLSRKPTASANTFSYSLVGHRAFVEYVESLGLGVLVRQTRAGIGTGPNTPLFVIAPDVDWVKADETRRIQALQREAARRSAPMILVLPKWHVTMSKEEEGWAATLDRMSESAPESILSQFDDPHISTLLVRQTGGAEGTTVRCSLSWQGGAMTFDTAPSQYLRETAAIEPIVKCPGGVLVGRRVLGHNEVGPELFIISDPDVLNNQGLDRADHAALMTQMLTRWLLADGIVIDETVHGYRRQAGLLYELFRFPLVLAVLQSMILLGVVLWAGALRFGKPLPERAGIESEGKGVLVDNTAKLLAYGGHSTDGLMSYFQQTLRAVADHYFMPIDLPEDELLGRLEKTSKARGIEIELRAVRARVTRLSTSFNDEQAVKVARYLHHWRQKMLEREGVPDSSQKEP